MVLNVVTCIIVTGFESLQIAAIRYRADSLKKCALTDALIAAFTHGKHKMAPFSQDILQAYNVFMLWQYSACINK